MTVVKSVRTHNEIARAVVEARAELKAGRPVEIACRTEQLGTLFSDLGERLSPWQHAQPLPLGATVRITLQLEP